MNEIKLSDNIINTLTPKEMTYLPGHNTFRLSEMYYVIKDTYRLEGVIDGFNV